MVHVTNHPVKFRTHLKPVNLRVFTLADSCCQVYLKQSSNPNRITSAHSYGGLPPSWALHKYRQKQLERYSQGKIIISEMKIKNFLFFCKHRSKTACFSISSTFTVACGKWAEVMTAHTGTHKRAIALWMIYWMSATFCWVICLSFHGIILGLWSYKKIR